MYVYFLAGSIQLCRRLELRPGKHTHPGVVWRYNFFGLALIYTVPKTGTSAGKHTATVGWRIEAEESGSSAWNQSAQGALSEKVGSVSARV